MPSFDTAAPIDQVVKTGVLTEAFQMVSPTVQEARILSEPSKTIRGAGECSPEPGQAHCPGLVFVS
jgi:hypothetical protein